MTVKNAMGYPFGKTSSSGPAADDFPSLDDESATVSTVWQSAVLSGRVFRWRDLATVELSEVDPLAVPMSFVILITMKSSNRVARSVLEGARAV